MDKIREYLQHKRMKENTLQNQIETLNNDIKRLNNDIEIRDNKIKLLETQLMESKDEIIKLQREIIDGRTCRRDFVENENKGTHRGRPKKVCNDERTTDGVCDEIQQSSVEGE